VNAEKDSRAAQLNRDCHCVLTDVTRLNDRLDGLLQPAIPLSSSHPHLFADKPVFVAPSHLHEMRALIGAIEEVTRLPAYRDTVLSAAAPIAHHDPKTRGVFYGFDFHIGPQGPKLIEINTNAGGGFLNAMAWQAQQACCDGVADYLARHPTGPELEDQIVAMFREEWRLARGDAPLRSVAIVDESPAKQFLFPEFQLARQLFERHGIRAHIADPSELSIHGQAVFLNGEPVDLVYNRHTDFYFETAATGVLREAYERDLAVITPHPRGHALFASKRNLAVLSDPGTLERLGVGSREIGILARTIPPTAEVKGPQENWWRDRGKWFFKPHSGFGGRGAYRGEKITRRVMAEVMSGGYMAQTFTPAGERHVSPRQDAAPFKVDIRCYAYAGRIQQMAARLYQGQTTNFRTPGGGFAPVYVVDESMARAERRADPALPA
jgi:hypothetical protein